jgi:hypothetical protein
LTVAPGFGTSDRIRSPSPRASASPKTSVTVQAATVNAAVRRRGRGPVATNSSPPINEGLMGLGLRSRFAEALLLENIADHARADPSVGRADLPDGLEHADKPWRSSEDRAQLG